MYDRREREGPGNQGGMDLFGLMEQLQPITDANKVVLYCQLIKLLYLTRGEEDWDEKNDLVVRRTFPVGKKMM